MIEAETQVIEETIEAYIQEMIYLTAPVDPIVSRAQIEGDCAGTLPEETTFRVPDIDPACTEQT